MRRFVIKRKRNKGLNYMKKKLFLIPITLISCLLSSCSSSKHINLEEYFKIQQDYSHVIIGEEDQYDYGHVVGNILGKYAPCANKQAFYSEESTQPWMTYSFKGYQDGFTYFKVDFYVSGKINTYCRKDSMLSREEQETTYTISNDIVSSLQKEVNTRMDEVRTIFEVEEVNAKAKGYATPDRFFDSLLNPKENDEPFMDTYFESTTQSKRFTNFTPELVQDLRNLDFKEQTYHNPTGIPSLISIRVNDDWSMNISAIAPYAYIYYVYHNTLTWVTLTVWYEINKEMRETLVSRCQEMIYDGTYIKA